MPSSTFILLDNSIFENEAKLTVYPRKATERDFKYLSTLVFLNLNWWINITYTGESSYVNLVIKKARLTHLLHKSVNNRTGASFV